MVFLFLGLLVAIVVAALAVAAVKGARKLSDGYARSNEVVPGIASAAPSAWLGSHDPEARLHRRLIDAVRALRSNEQFDVVGAFLDVQVELEQQAVTVDNSLVAVAALPVAQREEPLRKLTEAVESIERAVAELAVGSTNDVTERLATTLEGLRMRTSTLDQARAALERIDEQAAVNGGLPGGGDTDGSAEPGAAGGQPGGGA